MELAGVAVGSGGFCSLVTVATLKAELANVKSRLSDLRQSDIEQRRRFDDFVERLVTLETKIEG